MLAQRFFMPLLLTALSLGACTTRNIPTATEAEPTLNKALFSEVKDANIISSDFQAEFLSSTLGIAPVQDYLTINISPTPGDQTRLFTITLRAKSNEIKPGASFPIAKKSEVGIVNALYTQSVSIVLNRAFQGVSGTLSVDHIGGTISAPTVDFHLKDVKMEPTQENLGSGSFVFNFYGKTGQ